LHAHVGQPFASSTFPNWQAIAHTGGQTTGSGTHFPESQCVPDAHFTVAHGSGLHVHVGQPFASTAVPYWQ
jgi:hypothetical protein